MVQLLNVTAGDQLRLMAKFRLTWYLTAAPFLPDRWLDAPGLAATLREFFSARGLLFVSPLSALPGDAAIVWDVRILGQLAGRTVADLVALLEGLPVTKGGLAVRLVALRQLTTADGSGSLTEDQAAAREAANRAAQAGDLVNRFDRLLGNVGKGALLLLVLLLVGAGVILYRQRR